MGPETVLPVVRPAVLEHDTVVLPLWEPVGLSAQLLTVTVLAVQESPSRVFQSVPSYTWNAHELLFVEVRLRVCR